MVAAVLPAPLVAPTLCNIDENDPVVKLMPKFRFETFARPRYFEGEDGRLKCGVEVRDGAGHVRWSKVYDMLDEGDPA